MKYEPEYILREQGDAQDPIKWTEIIFDQMVKKSQDKHKEGLLRYRFGTDKSRYIIKMAVGIIGGATGGAVTGAAAGAAAGGLLGAVGGPAGVGVGVVAGGLVGSVTTGIAGGMAVMKHVKEENNKP